MILLRMLITAHDLLAVRGLWNTELCMVLFAMLSEGIGYAAALRAYAEFSGRSFASIERTMEEAARTAGFWEGARYILEECYREGIR